MSHLEKRSGAVVMGSMVILGASVMAQAHEPQVSEYLLQEARGSQICVFRDDVPRAAVRRVASTIAAEHAASVRFVYENTIKGFSVNMPPQAAANMAKNPTIAYCEQNGVATISGRPLQKAAKAIVPTITTQVAQETPYGVTRVGGPIAGDGKHAWIIDTGIDLDNPDLKVGPGANFILLGKKTTDDLNGHGTHVAGTIAAIDNTIDVVGVAAGATVHPVRVLDKYGSGTIDGVIAGVDWVAANAQPGDVANMSLGAYGHYQGLHDAVVKAADKGIFFAIAAGNDSSDAANYEPAHVEHPNVYTISAVDSTDLFASFSNYGNPPVDFAAPGVGVLSLRVGGGVVAYSGTSMATPHVAGLLLVLGGSPNSSGMAWGDPDGILDSVAHY